MCSVRNFNDQNILCGYFQLLSLSGLLCSPFSFHNYHLWNVESKIAVRLFMTLQAVSPCSLDTAHIHGMPEKTFPWLCKVAFLSPMSAFQFLFFPVVTQFLCPSPAQDSSHSQHHPLLPLLLHLTPLRCSSQNLAGGLFCPSLCMADLPCSCPEPFRSHSMLYPLTIHSRQDINGL